MVPNLPLFPICDDINSMATRPAIVENVKKKTKRDINKRQTARVVFAQVNLFLRFIDAGPTLNELYMKQRLKLIAKKKKGKKKNNNNEMSKKNDNVC